MDKRPEPAKSLWDSFNAADKARRDIEKLTAASELEQSYARRIGHPLAETFAQIAAVAAFQDKLAAQVDRLNSITGGSAFLELSERMKNLTKAYSVPEGLTSFMAQVKGAEEAIKARADLFADTFKKTSVSAPADFLADAFKKTLVSAPADFLAEAFKQTAVRAPALSLPRELERPMPMRHVVQPLPKARELAREFAERVAEGFRAWRAALPKGSTGNLLLLRAGGTPMIVTSIKAEDGDCLRVFGTVEGTETECFGHFTALQFEHSQQDTDDENGLEPGPAIH